MSRLETMKLELANAMSVYYQQDLRLMGIDITDPGHVPDLDERTRP